MNQSFLTQICAEIHLPEKTVQKVLKEGRSHPKTIRFLCSVARRNINFLWLYNRICPKKGPLRSLVICLLLCEPLKLRYEEKGIPQEIFWASASDLMIWADTYEKATGRVGLWELNWIRNTLSMELFRLGRLQYQMVPSYAYPPIPVSCRPFPAGEPVLNVHIPADGPLDRQACLESLSWAHRFFDQFFPGFQYRAVVCDSWLLHPCLKEMLPPTSHILQFQSLFQICGSYPAPPPLRYVYGDRMSGTIKDYPEDTSLQRAVKHRLMERQKMGNGFGYRQL